MTGQVVNTFYFFFVSVFCGKIWCSVESAVTMGDLAVSPKEKVLNTCIPGTYLRGAYCCRARAKAARP